MTTPDWVVKTFPSAVAQGRAGHAEVQHPHGFVLGWVSVWRYATGEVGIVVTHREPGHPTWMTQVWGGPLHGEAEVGPEGALQHARWGWRVAHGEQTRPEYFAPPGKRRSRW